jgi:hypothetical protein
LLTTRIALLLLLASPVMAACGDDSTEPGNLCETVSLPLHGAAQGPVVVDVGLEVQAGGIVLVATGTDPQGTANFGSLLQSAGVFVDLRCEGSPLIIQDDLAGSGVEETFGTVVDQAGNPALYGAIAAAATWPVTVDFQDIDGHHTIGNVLAAVRP